MDELSYPQAPHTIEGMDIPAALVQDLALRRALYEGHTSTTALSEGLALSMAVATSVVNDLRELRYVDVLGLDGRDYVLELTDQGREQARERMSLCRYAGPAPVSLAEYTAMIGSQQARPNANRATMREAFDDLVVGDDLLDQLGPALLTEGAVFLYGPPGTGKTSVAERLIRTHTDPVLVPRTVEVDAQIINVFDPVVHEPVDPQPTWLDPRWVLCRRPCIVTGGELTADQMDLTYEPNSGVYMAPVQMQANNGLLVIDDFGRQAMSPETLLNRWIVPLDRRRDYLSLSYGVRFEIPFDVKVVFSTNLEPSSLGDEAFFRRIENKVLVSPIDDDTFDTVLARVAAHHGIEVGVGAAEHLRRVSRDDGEGDLRPYLPHAVCKILRAVCTYESAPLVLDVSAVNRVASIYFTQETRMTGSQASGLPHLAAVNEMRAF